MARMLTALVLLSVAGGSLHAQRDRFLWRAGQVLNYRVEQKTTATEVLREGKSESKTVLRLEKQWRVTEVNIKGIATLQHSLTALRMELTTPTGETMLFDSANPAGSDPKLRDQLSKFVGVPLSTIRIDTTGHVIEVKESKFGPASRFEAEPPFVLELGGAEFKAGKTWERSYHITQEPPLGTGEKYEAVQRYSCAGVEGAGVRVALTTELKTQPPGLVDRVPLLQMQPEGSVVFDSRNGRLHSAVLKVRKELKDHAGDGTSYSFQSDYHEQFVER